MGSTSSERDAREGAPLASARLDEEPKALLRKILGRQAYRQLMLANIRGHGLKFLPDPADKIRLVRELEHGLEGLERVRRLYADLDGGDLATAVRVRMERIPYPTGRMELAACLTICDLAEREAMESCTDSICAEFAAIAHGVLGRDRGWTREGRELLVAFCADESQRPHAQQVFTRWVAIALRSLGRPDTPGDRRALALRLRSRGSAETIARFLGRLEPFQRACGLAPPDLSETGLELPGGTNA